MSGEGDGEGRLPGERHTDQGCPPHTHTRPHTLTWGFLSAPYEGGARHASSGVLRTSKGSACLSFWEPRPTCQLRC